MLFKQVSKEIAPIESRALMAWRALWPALAEPSKIERLKGDKETSKKSAHRLAGVGPEGSTIIAKRCRRSKALTERGIYEDVLPRVPVPALRYYGLVEEDDGEFCWLFLEDAGEEKYSPFIAEHRRLAARWLGLLHTSAARLAPAARPPDQGPSYYLERLRSAHERMRGGVVNPAVTVEERAVLLGALGLLELLEFRWCEVERSCEAMPRTVVHGDFTEKNIRLRTGEAGTLCLPFDWG